LNTNVRVAAELSKNPNSPTIELRERWREGEFVLLFSLTLLKELEDKLLEKGVPSENVQLVVTETQAHGELVEVLPSDVAHVIRADPDDDHVIACAVVGKATYIVTYDPHFEQLGGEHRGVKIVKPLEFLEVLRARER